jgi:dihydropteroate synthase
MIIQANRPTIMGILNVTPDSFSDGGEYNNINAAVQHALQMEAEGADIIDIGGESSGPGSIDVSVEEELKRTISIIKAIRKQSQILISIDTCKSKVADQAIEAGANIINDVTALRGDPEMAAVAAKHKCPIILMYSKDPSTRTTVKAKEYEDVIATIKNFLLTQSKKAQEAGVAKENIIFDPGMGQFISSIPSYSLEIIARLKELKELGHTLLVGISRKSFLGGKIEERDQIGLALTTIAYLNGVSIIRAHNIKIICQQWN